MDCPYHSLPSTSWWSKSVAGRSAKDIVPHLQSRLKIAPDTLVASAGSCFAQHISRALTERGYNYAQAEPAPPYLPAETASRYNYGVFSARYGNIYSTLQFLQLVQRALGQFVPADQYWEAADGRCFDLLRPRIVPGGFSSRTEAEADMRQHLASVRKLIETADVFVFTLGLTETWISRQDGTAYPTCPGCGSAGDYDPDKYIFENLSVSRCLDALSSAIELITACNPRIQFVLTVSPVPLIATMTDSHVLQASVYSKSVLRVVAGELAQSRPNVHYFASYELITATRNTHAFIEDDGRSISTDGVSHAMNSFFAHFSGDIEKPRLDQSNLSHGSLPVTPVVCDEEDFFRGLASSS